MKIRTDLTVGTQEGQSNKLLDDYSQCHKTYDSDGKCKKILCPFPPFTFPC